MVRGGSRRRWAALAPLVACWAATALAAPLALAPGDPAPALSGTTTPGGKPFAADWSQSQATLVNFWATWCLPCKVEMIQLQKLHERLESKGLRIVGVHDPADAAHAPAFLKDVGATYTVIAAGPRVDRSWGGIGTMPTSFLIDRQGTILRRYVGASVEQTDGLVADVEALLDGQPLPPQVLPRAVPTAPEVSTPTPGAR